MALLLPLHTTLPFHRLPPTSNTANPRSTRRVGSDLPTLRLRSTTSPPLAGRSPAVPPTPESSFHKKERGRREPVRNTPPRAWLHVPEGFWRLAGAIAAGLLCLGPGMTEASVDDAGRMPASPPCADVADYYSGLDGLEGAALRRRLGAIVSVHRSLAYKEVWDALKILDAADPNDPENSPENRDLLLESCSEVVGGKTRWMEQGALVASFIWLNRQTLLDGFT